MTEKNHLEQNGKGKSKYYQANGDIKINGLSYNDARQLFIDLFNANFPKLREEAAKIASERAEVITKKLIIEYSSNEKYKKIDFSDPEVQSDLYFIQKEYAKSGDEYLGDLLIKTFLNKNINEKRSFDQLILNECLNIIPKLTIDQINLLKLKFTTSNKNSYKIKPLYLENYLNEIVFANLQNLKIDFEKLIYLEHIGCGKFVDRVDGQSYHLNFISKLSNYFSYSYDAKDLKIKFGENLEKMREIFIESVFDKNEIQFKNKSLSIHHLKSFNIDEKTILDVKSLNQKDNQENEANLNEFTYKVKEATKKQNIFLNRFNINNIGLKIGEISLILEIEKKIDKNIFID